MVRAAAAPRQGKEPRGRTGRLYRAGDRSDRPMVRCRVVQRLAEY